MERIHKPLFPYWYKAGVNNVCLRKPQGGETSECRDLFTYGNRFQEMLVEFSCLRFASEANVIKVGRREGPEPKSGRVKRLLLGRGIPLAPANGMYSMWKERARNQVVAGK